MSLGCSKERTIHAHGLISILKQLHDDLDAAVLDAYGWPPTLTDDQLLEKLVALNHQRAAEEKQSIIKYLRDFQNPTGATKQTQSAFIDTTPAKTKSPGIAIPAAPSTQKTPFPKSLPDQTKALRDLLAAAPPTGLTPADLSARFTGKNKDDRTQRITKILNTLLALNQVRQPTPDHYAPT